MPLPPSAVASCFYVGNNTFTASPKSSAAGQPRNAETRLAERPNITNLDQANIVLIWNISDASSFRLRRLYTVPEESGNAMSKERHCLTTSVGLRNSDFGRNGQT